MSAISLRQLADNLLDRVAGLPGTSARRTVHAHAILVEQLDGDGPVLSTDAQVDDATAVVTRYARAAAEGATDYNLSLLAQAAANLIARDHISPGEFLALADVLAVVTPPEMEVVATLYEYINDCGVLISNREKRCAGAERRAIELLVPSVFPTADVFRATCAGLIRTGLIEMMLIYGDVYYAPSALADRLHQIIPLGECGLAKVDDGGSKVAVG